jgi:hypothetical protein
MKEAHKSGFVGERQTFMIAKVGAAVARLWRDFT